MRDRECPRGIERDSCASSYYVRHVAEIYRESGKLRVIGVGIWDRKRRPSSAVSLFVTVNPAADLLSLARHEILLVPTIEMLDWIEHGLTEFYKGWADAQRSPVSQCGH
jgi:hypothetical protein